MGEEKKTQIGTTPGRTVRPTGSPPLAAAPGAAQPAAGTPVPVERAQTSPSQPPDPAAANAKAKTSYLAEAPDPLLGASIADRYRIIRKLGEGGMGAVYLALHTVLEKQVALKVLHGEFARKPDLVERFMQEAKAASRIRHENVIDISDFGATPDGLVFFAMELLNGHDLHDEITRAKLAGNLLPWSRTKKIFLQVCSALTAAHARGIIHRDLKPENIYLVDFLGDHDFVKLLDFGIAKLTDVSGNEEGARKLTKTGMLFGTPEYMSPEQARGEKVDHRVDIYAMGCILFQLITNQVPFQADNFMGVLSQHLTAEPPQISPVVLDQIGAPRAIADIVDKALTKEPDTRWQTIDEMAAAIREACGDPAPADRSGKMRAAAVPTPTETTRKRPPTDVHAPVTSARTRNISGPQQPQPGDSAASDSRASPRTKTAWTGNLTVPEVEDAGGGSSNKSKLPLIIGAIVLAGGAVAAAIVLTSESSTTAGQGSGSAIVEVGGGSATGSAAVAPSVPPVEPPPVVETLPAMVQINLDSTPSGALVVDASDPKKEWGKTPTTVSIPGSLTPVRFKFVLKGHGDAVVELVPSRASIDVTQPLTRGATKPGAAVTKVPDAPAKPADPVVTKVEPATTKPAAGSGSAATESAAGGGTTTATTKPEPPKDPAKDPPKDPNEVQQLTKPSDCPDDEPCLKPFETK